MRKCQIRGNNAETVDNRIIAKRMMISISGLPNPSKGFPVTNSNMIGHELKILLMFKVWRL